MSLNPNERFWKMFRPEFADAIESVSKCKQMTVLAHMIRNLNYRNQYVGTIDETVKQTNCLRKRGRP